MPLHGIIRFLMGLTGIEIFIWHAPGRFDLQREDIEPVGMTNQIMGQFSINDPVYIRIGI